MGFVNQVLSLYWKNALVAWRNRGATILRLLVAPMLFLLLALIIDKSNQANDARTKAFSDLPNPSAQTIGPIPQCSSDMYIGKSKSCTEILYSPNNTVANQIMANVVSNNDITIHATGYLSQDAIQAFLINTTDFAIGAVHFIFDDPVSGVGLNGFILQTNTTTKFFKATFQDPNFFVQLPLQSAVQREIVRYQLSLNPATAPLASKLVWNIGAIPFAHPAINPTSILGYVLGPFIFAACMFSFVSQVSIFVSEKELGLRQALRTMGMMDSAFWLSWGAWEFTLALFTGNIITIFGMILQFNLFLKNSYGLLFFLFFLFQLAMSSLALVLCALIKRTAIAVYIGFAVFLVGWIMQTVVAFGVPYTPSYYKTLNGALTVIFSLFPWDLLSKGFVDLNGATVSDTSPGLKWNERSSYCQDVPIEANQWAYNPNVQYINFTCVMSLNQIYNILIALWLGYFFLAIYIDNVLPNETGNRRPFYYILQPSYWFPFLSTGNNLSNLHDNKNPPNGSGVASDSDVLEEESRVRALLNHRTGRRGELASAAPDGEQRNAVEVYGLKRVFGHNPCGGGCFFCCESGDQNPKAFWAIKGSWFAIPENQLFCLLGPNGAGKSTTINVLTGVLPPTYGESLVYGESISSVGAMERIRGMMGVCPQFDVLWGELSGIEHLQIYGSIKGVDRKVLNDSSWNLLERVKLTYAAKQRTSAYSGGMKRRLSVALALLGDPKIVYLDEPTTGMDPISRRYVWDIIQEAKVGRAIVLTTHSMEEADILGDRIAIMARGKLRCIGTSLRLKQRFGSGYNVSISVVPPRNAVGAGDAELIEQRSNVVRQLFMERLGLKPEEEGRVYISYLVPNDKEEQLVAFLKELERDSERIGITDIQLSLTSLEEVFLNIAKMAEIEEARLAGNGQVKLVNINLPDGTTVSAPIGQEFILSPYTNAPFKIIWGTDESGNLCVLEVKSVSSDEVPNFNAPAQAPLIPVAQAAHRGGAPPAIALAHQPAVAAPTGFADYVVSDGSVLRVPAGQPFVLNPVTNKPYKVTWGSPDPVTGAPRILACDLYVPPPQQRDPEPPKPVKMNSNGGGSSRDRAVTPVSVSSSSQNDGRMEIELPGLPGFDKGSAAGLP